MLKNTLYTNHVLIFISIEKRNKKTNIIVIKINTQITKLTIRVLDILKLKRFYSLIEYTLTIRASDGQNVKKYKL